MQIYEFELVNPTGKKNNTFYMACDSKRQLIHRVVSSYRVTPNEIKIIGEYDFDSYEPNKKKIDQTRMSKANELFGSATRKVDTYRNRLVKKGYNLVEISSAEDVYNLLENNSEVLVHWDCTEVRNQHKYYALVK